MQKFNTLKSIPAYLPIVNIDTDMIIPKQFLKTIKRTGLGKNLFFEMRYDDKGAELSDFILNKNPYNNVLDTMEVLTKVNQVDGSGGLVGASMKKALMDNIPSVLAAVATLGAAGSVFGTGGLAGSLLMYGLLVSMANSKKFARQLTQEIKPLTKGDTLFKMLKDRTHC